MTESVPEITVEEEGYPARLEPAQNFALLKVIASAVDKYLKSVSFGVWSMWYHGAAGRQRATKLQAFLRDSAPENVNALALVSAILSCKGRTLRDTITLEIQSSTVFDGTQLISLQPDTSLRPAEQRIKALSDMLNLNFEINESFLGEEIEYLRLLA